MVTVAADTSIIVTTFKQMKVHAMFDLIRKMQWELNMDLNAKGK